MGKRFQFFIGRHHVSITVVLAFLAMLIRASHREKAGAVEIDVGIEILPAERIDLAGMVLRDMCITKVLRMMATFLGSTRALSFLMLRSKTGLCAHLVGLGVQFH